MPQRNLSAIKTLHCHSTVKSGTTANSKLNLLINSRPQGTLNHLLIFLPVKASIAFQQSMACTPLLFQTSTTTIIWRVIRLVKSLYTLLKQKPVTFTRQNARHFQLA